MTRTVRIGLPLLQASQAQKHVTVNEALVRLDALSQLVLKSRSNSAPPVSPTEGDAWAVASSPVNAWEGRGGEIAIHTNGGWDFVTPLPGWRAWIEDEGLEAVWNGGIWVTGAISLSPSGSGFQFRSHEIDHVLAPGASSTTAPVIPAQSLVFGVTGRVLADLEGSATGLQVGVSESSTRYGSGIGTTAGSWLRGLTSTPIAYYVDTPLVLTGENGDFTGGTIRLVVHFAELGVPGT